MSLPLPTQLLAGLALAAAIALAAYLARALDRGGAAAAALLGAVVFGLGGLPWAVILVGFFVTSSALSRLFRRRKARFDEKFSKGTRRDAGQVLANGGVAGLAAALAWLAGSIAPAGSPLRYLLWLAFCASLAAATADTWATELGVLSRRAPVLITSGKPVEAGTSGGVSLAGLLAAAGGSALIALLGWWMERVGLASGAPITSAGLQAGLYGLVFLAGLAGSLVDSTLGATVQAIYTCPTCHKETERHPLHTCGTPTVHSRGWGWLDNDLVNTACTLSAALLALAVGLALTPGAPPGASSAPVGLAATPPPTIQMSSPDFASGSGIPPANACTGANRSPALSWSGVPVGTASLVLIVQDPDAPRGTFTHWLVYNLPPGANGLPAGLPVGAEIAPAGSQGKNDFGHLGYDGPCPPAGSTHRYDFRLYATDLAPGALPPGLAAPTLEAALAGHVLAAGELVGTFSR